MTCIGSFKETGDGWAGKITTVTFNRACALQRNEAKSADSEQPDYRVVCGPAEIGAAWIKNNTEDGRRVVSVRINAPVAGKFNALLVEDKPSVDEDEGETRTTATAQLYFRN
ncbi:DUF736 family protein (plasmid) [Azospirillum sp. HJ39]|uniref:DUF736 domain-containing protein n=1 Tax=Azospirillum sp. HJ39 TaxID=3159496 RepID=UPI0035565431